MQMLLMLNAIYKAPLLLTLWAPVPNTQLTVYIVALTPLFRSISRGRS